MLKILFIDTVHPILQKLLEEKGHGCVDGSKLSKKEVLSVIHEYDGIVIRSRIPIDQEILDAATNLRFIARAGVGMESIDVDYANKKGIHCLNSPEGSRDAVGEFAVGMLLSLLNKINKADREVRKGEWNREPNRGIEINGKTIGIMGYGNMGSSFAKKLSGFDCNVIAYDKYLETFSNAFATRVSMTEIFDQSDILSLHVPLTHETTFLVNNDFIQRFKKNIFIINTARGKCLKIDDLVDNLKTGKILGACLDVNEYEDSSFEKSSIFSRLHRDQSSIESSWQYLIKSENVIITPHIAGWTVESHEKISRVLFEKIMALVQQ